MPVKIGLKTIEKWKESLEEQVLRYEQEDALQGQIVFYGPSNFTRWSERWGMTPLAEAVLGKSGAKCCINRGFGSSSTEHHLYYYSRMVRPLNPKVMVYAPGLGNSLSFGYTPEETFDLAQRVVQYAMSDMPGLKVYLCGLNRNRPNQRTPVALEYDRWLQEFAAATPNCTYVDIGGYAPLDRMDILAEDNTHFNKAGYEIYAELFREVLKEELEQY